MVGVHFFRKHNRSGGYDDLSILIDGKTYFSSIYLFFYNVHLGPKWLHLRVSKGVSD
jgi:hypothetical protein